jgi:cyclase
MKTARILALVSILTLTATVATNLPAQNQDVQVMHIRGPMFLISAGGASITASIGMDGVLLVDTGPAAVADKVKAAVQDIQKQLAVAQAWMSQAPAGGSEVIPGSILQVNQTIPANLGRVAYIMNTSVRPEHNGGNPKLALALPKELSFQDPSEIATHVYAHENVLQRLSGASGDPAAPFELWPSDTFYYNPFKLTTYFNGEGVVLMHVPNAITDGDSFVWFRKSDVIAAGDIYRTDAYPTPDLTKGGNIKGVIEGLNQLIDLAVPEYRQEGGTMIIPGHGRISDIADVGGYRDMVTIVRDRVEHLISQGKTLDQIKAARPSADYDPRYGKEPGSSDRFIEAIYRSLTSKS